MNQKLRVGFVRGTAPQKWQRRWRESGRQPPLELVALSDFWAAAALADQDSAEPALDVAIERVPSGASPATSTRHAVRLYDEELALVLPIDHELAAQPLAATSTAELAALLSPLALTVLRHEDDPAEMVPLLDLVAAGSAAAVMPLPLARHLVRKRAHAVGRLSLEPGTADEPAAGSSIWAVWDKERDDETIQDLIGVFRGRTAASGRDSSAKGSRAQTAKKQPQATGGQKVTVARRKVARTPSKAKRAQHKARRKRR